MSLAVQSKQRPVFIRDFHPDTSRREFENWILDVFQNVSFEDAFHQKRLGVCGVPFSEIAIECLLAGLFSEAQDLLHRAYSFLRVSLDRKEQVDARHLCIAERCALITWLYHRKEDRKTLRCAMDQAKAQVDSKKAGRANVQRSLPLYLEAKEYDALLERFESLGRSAPADLRRIRSQGMMAYVIAKHRVGSGYSQQAVDQALAAFLNRSMSTWLARGQFSTAARWMKIAHWQPGDDPIATLLRCYDYLSGLEPPTNSPA